MIYYANNFNHEAMINVLSMAGYTRCFDLSIQKEEPYIVISSNVKEYSYTPIRPYSYQIAETPEELAACLLITDDDVLTKYLNHNAILRHNGLKV